jgi:uncharacterized membrane protein YoaK (UPF0700 family)
MNALRQLRLDQRLVVAMAGLTILTGLVDATSYLGLGHVFTANMTGNVVFLGFAFGGAAGFSISASLVALAAFLAGALIGGRLVGADHSAHRAAPVFALQSVALVAAAVVAWAVDKPGIGASRWALLALLAAAMGLQNAAARRLAVADMTTTVLTLTLTGIAADSRLAGGSDSRIARRGASVLLMLAGAAGGAALKAQGLGWPLTAGATLAVATTIWMASTPSESSPTKPSGTTITTDNPATTTST